MTRKNTPKEFRIAIEQEENAYFKYDDHDVFPTQIVYQNGDIQVNARVMVTPTSDERVAEIRDYVQEVFGDDVSVEYERTEHIDSSDIPHTVDRYSVNI